MDLKTTIHHYQNWRIASNAISNFGLFFVTIHLGPLWGLFFYVFMVWNTVDDYRRAELREEIKKLGGKPP
jgi:hypothetical protein